MAISLVSVPLVLKALGASDYGIYHLVAGIVAMLSFLNASMTVSSQRYMSVAMGTKDESRVDKVFNASFWIHLIIGVAIVLLLECGAFFIDKLNIPDERMGVALIIYQFLIVSTFIRILNVPFNALTNAHEDMLAFSVIDIIDSLCMLALAYALHFVTSDRLIFYGLCVALIAVLNFIMLYGWTRHAYKQYRIRLKKNRDSLLIKEMFGFAGWNVFGAVAMIGRNQGIAVIINMFLGTIANAAYGVANQINGALLHFSETFQKAINPQLMKSEGMNDRKRLYKILFISSKFSVLALCFFAIPLIIEMQEVLHLWLGEDIPPFTLRLSQFILLFSIVNQYSSGLKSAVQATGNIRNYQIIMGVLILMNLPVCYVLLKLGYPVYYVTAGYVVLEIISLVVRIIIAHRITGMSVSDYMNNVIRTTLLIIGISTALCLIPHFLINEGFARLLITVLVFCSVYLFLIWCLAFDQLQREGIRNTIKAKFNIFSKHIK